MSRTEADDLYEKHYPSSEVKGSAMGPLPTNKLGWKEKQRITSLGLTAEGLPIPETSITVEDRVFQFQE